MTTKKKKSASSAGVPGEDADIAKRRTRLNNAELHLSEIRDELSRRGEDAPRGLIARFDEAQDKIDDANADFSERNVHVATSLVQAFTLSPALTGLKVQSGSRKAKRLRGLDEQGEEREEFARNWLRENPTRDRGWKSCLARQLAATELLQSTAEVARESEALRREVDDFLKSVRAL
jgi:hypothetical protein